VKIFKLLLTLLPAVGLMLFLNGNISIPGAPLPALAKFLHPARGVWNNGEPNKYSDQSLKFSEVSGKAEVIYDERLVPHIYAENLKDALFLQGYVEAEQRLFQMDFMTRAASGRLSEVLGQVTLPVDKDRLRSQIDTAAGNAVIAWTKTSEYPLLQAYVAGINKYISSLKPENYPYEYKLLGFEPEPWTIKKSALVYKSMADVLAGNSFDMEYTNMRAALGNELFSELYPEYEDGGYPVIGNEKKYGYPSYKEAQDSSLNKIYYNQYYKNITPGIGSNNWALSKSKTKDEATILCNDPHLGLSIPSIWIEEHINLPNVNAYGVSFPGFPGIMIGFNDHIAWGETNVGHDVEDMFEIKWVDNNRNEYWLDGKKEKADKVIKPIKIKGMKEPYIDTLIYTKMGIIKLKSNDGKSDLAVRWLAVDKQSEAEYMTFVDVMQATNFDEYKKGLLKFNTPAQNFLFASKSGDIALTVNGKLPLRQQEDGRFVESGQNSKNDWSDYIPRDQNPQILNPKAGYVASANQRSGGKDYPYYYTGKFEHFRNRVINDTLSNRNNFDVKDMMALQGNNASMIAKSILPMVFKVADENKIKNDNLEKLRSWDYSYNGNISAPVVFDKFYEILYKNTFDEIESLKDTMDVMRVENWVFIDLLLNKPQHKIFDNTSTPSIETSKEIIFATIKSFDKDVKPGDLDKTWGKHRPVDILHYTRIPALSVKDIETGGVAHAPNAMQKNFGPSWRMIVKYGAQLEAYGVFPGGQSGNPLSKFYSNNIEKWAKNEYYTLSAPTDRKSLKSMMKYSIN
jgi:penicillin G amidase